MKRALSILSMGFFAAAAQAQAYDVDMSLGAYAFAGTLTYASGALTAVSVSDGSPAFGAFMAAEDVTSNGATLIDYEGRTAAMAGSQFFTLAFTTQQSFGATVLNTNNIVLDIFGDEGYACGPPGTWAGKMGFVSCSGTLTDPPKLTAHAAPELDPTQGISAVILLVGAGLVLSTWNQRRLA